MVHVSEPWDLVRMAGGHSYSDCGAMDLSSNHSFSADEEDDEKSRKRKSVVGDPADSGFTSGEATRKRAKTDDITKWTSEEAEEARRKEFTRMKNKRKNIKSVMREERLDAITKAARAEEEARLARLAHQQQQQLEALKAKQFRTQVMVSFEEEEEKPKEGVITSSSDSECKVVLDEPDDEDDEEDPNNSGLHVDDALNVPNDAGEVLVNVGRPKEDRPVMLAPQLAASAKPHQIGGIRFMYDNIIETEERMKRGQGMGCILAHSMGLGKTFQVVSFTDIFLTRTGGRRVLIIVPINTIQNWLAEYNYWLPAKVGLVGGNWFG